MGHRHISQLLDIDKKSDMLTCNPNMPQLTEICSYGPAIFTYTHKKFLKNLSSSSALFHSLLIINKRFGYGLVHVLLWLKITFSTGKWWLFYCTDYGFHFEKFKNKYNKQELLLDTLTTQDHRNLVRDIWKKAASTK